MFFAPIFTMELSDVAPEKNYCYDRTQKKYTKILSLQELSMRTLAHATLIPHLENLQADRIDVEAKPLIKQLKKKLNQPLQDLLSQYTMNYFYVNHDTIINRRRNRLNIYCFLPRLLSRWNIREKHYLKHEGKLKEIHREKHHCEGECPQMNKYIRKHCDFLECLKLKEFLDKHHDAQKDYSGKTEEQDQNFTNRLKAELGIDIESCIQSEEKNEFAALGSFDIKKNERKIYIIQHDENDYKKLVIVQVLKNSHFNNFQQLTKYKNGILKARTNIQKQRPCFHEITEFFDCAIERSVDNISTYYDNQTFDYSPPLETIAAYMAFYNAENKINCYALFNDLYKSKFFKNLPKRYKAKMAEIINTNFTDVSIIRTSMQEPPIRILVSTIAAYWSYKAFSLATIATIRNIPNLMYLLRYNPSYDSSFDYTSYAKRAPLIFGIVGACTSIYFVNAEINKKKHRGYSYKDTKISPEKYEKIGNDRLVKYWNYILYGSLATGIYWAYLTANLFFTIINND